MPHSVCRFRTRLPNDAPQFSSLGYSTVDGAVTTASSFQEATYLVSRGSAQHTESRVKMVLRPGYAICIVNIVDMRRLPVVHCSGTVLDCPLVMYLACSLDCPVGTIQDCTYTARAPSACPAIRVESWLVTYPRHIGHTQP